MMLDLGEEQRNTEGRPVVSATDREQVHRTPLPNIMLVNVQLLENTLDDLRARVALQCDMRDCLYFPEIWLTPTMSDRAVTMSDSFSVFCMDRTAESNKAKGGGCLLLGQQCSPHLEYLSIKCSPLYLPRKFTLGIATAVCCVCFKTLTRMQCSVWQGTLIKITSDK